MTLSSDGMDFYKSEYGYWLPLNTWKRETIDSDDWMSVKIIKNSSNRKGGTWEVVLVLGKKINNHISLGKKKIGRWHGGLYILFDNWAHRFMVCQTSQNISDIKWFQHFFRLYVSISRDVTKCFSCLSGHSKFFFIHKSGFIHPHIHW